MSRDWCIAVRPAPEATPGDLQLVEVALKEREPAFDFERDGDEFFVYVDNPHSARRTEKAVMHVLHRRGVSACVVEPLPIGRWDEHAHRYLFLHDRHPSEPVPPEEIGWVVVVQPASAFEWRPLRTALDELGRTRLHETKRAIEVGARDEEDAAALRAELTKVACAGATTAHPLNWFQRWHIREQLLGNYAGDMGDPTQVF